MKIFLKLISMTGLLITLLSGILTGRSVLTLQTHYTYLLTGMALWFAAAPFWMKSQTD